MEKSQPEVNQNSWLELKQKSHGGILIVNQGVILGLIDAPWHP